MAKKKSQQPRFDPVEEAKLSLETETPEEATPDEPSSEIAQERASASEKPPEGRLPTAPPVAQRLPFWRVLETKKAQVLGQRHVIPKGELLDEESYGSAAIQSLIEQGVKLERVERG